MLPNEIFINIFRLTRAVIIEAADIKIAAARDCLNKAIKIETSATKPSEHGKPEFANVKIKKIATKFGITDIKPP